MNGLDHIAIAVKNLDTAIELWCKIFRTQVAHREVVSDQQVEVAMIPVGDLKIELVSPISEESPVAKFLAKRGEGIHHFAVRAESTQAELDRLQELQLPLIDKTARIGAAGSKIAFLHPKALNGVLVELVQPNGK